MLALLVRPAKSRVLTTMTHWLPGRTALRDLSPDGWLLFAARCLRLFAYGLVAVILVLYLAALGFSETRIGVLLALTLIGDTFISLWITTRADRLGRRRMLRVGSVLMLFAAVVFAVSGNFWLLAIAATIGVLSPSGNEVGPFLSIEQAGLSGLVTASQRTDVFAWYNLIGAFATALGSLTGGFLVSAGQAAGLAGAAAYRPALLLYGVAGVGLWLIFRRLTPGVEAPATVGPPAPSTGIFHLGLGESRRTVLRLSALFAMDSFAGGLVLQTVLAYWFARRFGVTPAVLGSLFFCTNVLAGLSYLAAGWLASRIGLLRTMVYTHLPSNLLLMLVPLMPGFLTAAAMLLARSAISQMDVPTRQAYLMAVVQPHERAAAAGVTGVARSIGAALAPPLATVWAASLALASLPFFCGGAIKIIYDLLLFRGFRHLQPEHEREVRRAGRV